MATCGKNRPHVIVAEKFVSDFAHMDKVLRVGADTAEDAENRLHEQGRLHQPALQKMGESVQMTNVVALEFEARPATFPQFLKNIFNILEGVPEYKVPGI